MIHAFALEPQLVATWGKREEFRFIYDKFGLGTPRVLLELPAFGKWKDAVCDAATKLDVTQLEWKRLEELFKLFSEHRCRRTRSLFEGVPTWLENAEHEYARVEFRAIVASANPRRHPAVVIADDLGAAKAHRWSCTSGAAPTRTPEELAACLSAMLVNCTTLHLIDPYFAPDSPGHTRVLQALVGVISTREVTPDLVRVHCQHRCELSVFEAAAVLMARRLPAGIWIEFVRLRQRLGGEKLHNRYALTDLGGVAIGVGLDAGSAGETDDVNLLSREQYQLRWSQYAGDTIAFETVDTPRRVRGTRVG